MGYAALRVIIAVVFAWVLQLLATDNDSALLLTTAFVAEIVPDTVIRRLREVVRVRQLDDLIEKDPLTRLEGVDIYDRIRLEQEGVTNIEALAHHDLVKLMLDTRIPVGQLVDWVDQAILVLHLGEAGDEKSEREKRRSVLRSQGIRTATDLVRNYEKAMEQLRSWRKQAKCEEVLYHPEDFTRGVPLLAPPAAKTRAASTPGYA